MPRVIAALMRHGHYHQPPNTPSAHLPHPLTELGEQQAVTGAGGVGAVAEAKGWRLDATIETSHLLRAWQTGGLVSRAWAEAYGRSFRVESFEELAERSVGSAANLTEREITAIVEKDPRHSLPPDWRFDSRLRLPFTAAESLLESGARVFEHLERRFDELGRSTEVDIVRLVVGHAGSIRHAAIHMGILEMEDVLGLGMENCGTVYFERVGERSWKHVHGDWTARERKPPRD